MNPRPEPLTLSDSPDPQCGRRAQLARLFRLYAFFAASSGRVSQRDLDALKELLRQLKDTSEDPAYCPAA